MEAALMQYLEGAPCNYGVASYWLCACSFTIAAMVIGWAVMTKMREHVVGPALVGRTVRQQGLRVLPHTPVVGDLPRLKRLEREAQSHHHLLFPYLLDQHLRGGESFVFWVGNQPTWVLNNLDHVKSVRAHDVKLF